MRTRKKLWRPAGLVLFTLLSAMVIALLSSQRPVHAAQAAVKLIAPGNTGNSRVKFNAALRHRLASSEKEKATPNDAAATQGPASFLGNLTTMTAPGATALFLARQPDCSLTLSAFDYMPSGPSFTTTAIAPHYELTLHNQSLLKTQADLFAHGCAEATLGIGSRSVVYAGKTTQGLSTFAGSHYDASDANHPVVTVAVNSDSTLNSYASDPSIDDSGSLTAGDFNGDGNPDFVVVNSNTQAGGSVSILLGNANGTFQPAVDYATTGKTALTAVVDDVNGDGKLDIVVASDTQQICVLLGKGDGTFNPAQSFAVADPMVQGEVVPIQNLITADLRGMGRKDVIASNGIVLLSNGDGTFTATPNLGFPATLAFLAAGDLNHDGHTDLVVGTGVAISIYLGKGDGTFTPGNSYASIGNEGRVTVSDLDGDGNLDIYSGLADGGLFGGDDDDKNLAYAILGNGDGTFQGAPYVPASYTGTNLGDINGDGKPDLVGLSVGLSGDSFTPYLGGSFSAGTPLAVPASFTLGGHAYTGNTASSFYALADVNGDGKADLIFTATVTGLFQYSNEPIYFVALGQADGSFATPVPAAVSLVGAGDFDYEDTLYGLQAADIDGDGHIDLIFTYTGQSYNSIYAQGFAILLGNGDGTFKAPVLQTTYSNTTAPAYFLGPQIAAIGDVNGDHKPDLMVVAETSIPNPQVTNTQMELLLGNGDGTFGQPSVIATATNPVLPINTPTPAVLADLNGDGHLDLICVGDTPAGQGQLAISLGNGDGTFGAPSILNTTDGGGGIISLDGLAVADFNGDGKADIAVSSFDASASGIYFGNGDGTVTTYNSSEPTGIFNLLLFRAGVAADFNGDGKPDLLVGNTLLLNSYGAATALAPTTTTLTASATSITTGTSVTLTATVSGAGGTPTGTVTFLDGSTSLGTASLSGGTATLTTTALAAGSQSITADYAGDTTFSSSISAAVTITVTVGPALTATTTKLTASAASIITGTSVTLTATVSGTGGTPTGTVTFSDGSTKLGTGVLSAGTATYSATTLAVGSHSITAAYGGDTTLLLPPRPL